MPGLMHTDSFDAQGVDLKELVTKTDAFNVDGLLAQFWSQDFSCPFAPSG